MTVGSQGGRDAGARQLALGVGLDAARRFETFVATGNELVVAALKGLLQGKSTGHVYLSGGAGTGKTHLLQACCAMAAADGGRVAYLPLAQSATLDESILHNLEQAVVLCIDDVDRVAADALWQGAMFRLYNDADAAGVPMVFAGRLGPARAGLEDLRSRLSAALRLTLRAPDDAHRAAVLHQRARDLGLQLKDEVLAYVLARQSRDLGDLTALLESLDHYALVKKRRITVALVREYLARSH